MSKESLGALLFVGVLFAFFFWPRIVQFLRWLKGSRKTYFLSGGEENYIKDTKTKFRTPTQRYDSWGYLQKSVIEISQGPFRRRSAIYGPAAEHWGVEISWNVSGTSELPMVYLTSLDAMDPCDILRAIHKYPSLPAMLNLIAKLEEELAQSRSERTQSISALQALEIKMVNDRQHFRSPNAEKLRANIQYVLRELGAGSIMRQLVDVWLEKFSKPEANKAHHKFELA